MKLLLCPPDYFSIAYEINPWMHTAKNVDPKRAQQQFDALVRTYKKLGCTVVFLPPHPTLPDLVFTANAAVIHKKTALVASFKNKERQPESPIVARWFRAHGWRVRRMPKGAILEGQGEAFFTNGFLFAGWGLRGNKKGHAALAQTFRVPVVSLRIVDSRFYHLDTCFCPLPDGTVLYYPGAFDAASVARIKKYARRAVAVSTREALDFACNSVPLSGNFITGAHLSAATQRVLHKLGYRIVRIPLDEFKKSGGGARCLTLQLE